MTEKKEQTMTIANVSMSPKEETARIIRATCKKYDIAISQLMNAIISSQLPHIDDFAKIVVREKQQLLEKEEQRRREMISQANQTGIAKQPVNLFDEWRKLSHSQQVTDARISNLANDFTAVNSKLDLLLKELGVKSAMEPIDSPAWSNNTYVDTDDPGHRVLGPVFIPKES